MTGKTKITRLVVALLCGSILVGAPFFAMAEDEDLHQQMDQVQQQMSEQSNKKDQAQTTIVNVSEQLHQIQIDLDQAKSDLVTIQAQRAQVDANIATNEKELKVAEEHLHQRESIFFKRVRDIYINGRLSYLDVVLGSKDFSDFANRVDVLKRIIGADMSLIKDIKSDREEIQNRRTQLEADRAKIVDLEKQAQDKQALIEQKKQEREAVLQKAQTDKATAMEAIDELNQASANITAMLKKRQADRAAAAAAAAEQQQASQASYGGSSDYVQGTGALSWPVNGTITSDFGYRTHPIWGTTIFHSGIDIGVDYGTPVHAADGGVVVYADWISGYGNAVIIDHGNGLSTLYGHNESLAVSEGQSVSKGQVISYAGSTGNSTGPHVHFEVRADGDPVNPLNYL